MTEHTLYEQAQTFIDTNKTNYKHLVEDVKSVCEKIERVEKQYVKSTYSRGDKHKDGLELKETWKLPKKLLKIRAESGPTKGWRDIPDIIGVTVVVYYPDQIKPILQHVLDELEAQNIKLDSAIRTKTEFGYHADHAVVVSRHRRHPGLRCEIQCKTMLHDAWATKMHDLTYKPMGFLEPRLKLLMEAFGDTLERVERQSQAIRDMIMEKWNAEGERRRLTHGGLFLRLAGFIQRTDISDEAKQIRKFIEDHENEIRQAANADDDVIEDICRRIDVLCDTKVEEGWVLAALIASFYPKPDLDTYLAQYAEQWLAHAGERLQAKDTTTTTNSVLAVPLAYIAAGNMDLAIGCYERLLAAPQNFCLSDEEIGRCKFNTANALVERHYYDPDDARDGPVQQLRERVSKLLDEAKALREIPEDEKERARLEASAKDTNGFMQITFASTPEQVGAGLDLCNEARLVAQKLQFALGEQYCDLHLRLGWRKLLELEASLNPKA